MSTLKQIDKIENKSILNSIRLRNKNNSNLKDFLVEYTFYFTNLKKEIFDTLGEDDNASPTVILSLEVDKETAKHLKHKVNRQLQDKGIRNVNILRQINKPKISVQNYLDILTAYLVNEYTLEVETDTIDTLSQELEQYEEEFVSVYSDQQGKVSKTDKDIAFIIATQSDDRNIYEKFDDNIGRLYRMVRANGYLSFVNPKAINTLPAITNSFRNNINTNIETFSSAVVNQAHLNALQRAKIGVYTFRAVMDNRTTEVCKSLNGKSFKVSQAQVGINFPPLHFKCRSSVVGNNGAYLNR